MAPLPGVRGGGVREAAADASELTKAVEHMMIKAQQDSWAGSATNTISSNKPAKYMTASAMAG